MKVKIKIVPVEGEVLEIDVPNKATHWRGDLLDSPLWFYVTKIGVVGDHWFVWDEKKKEWVFFSHTEPANIRLVEKEMEYSVENLFDRIDNFERNINYDY
jgi:hypothetical protein